MRKIDYGRSNLVTRLEQRETLVGKKRIDPRGDTSTRIEFRQFSWTISGTIRRNFDRRCKWIRVRFRIIFGNVFLLYVGMYEYITIENVKIRYEAKLN